MKPEQFIREYGVKKAREVVEGRKNTYMPELFKYWSEELQDYVLAPKYASFLVDDLKRLVESLDRIDKFSGIKEARKLAGSSLYFTADRESMYRAIRDHESIYGGGDE